MDNDPACLPDLNKIVSIMSKPQMLEYRQTGEITV